MSQRGIFLKMCSEMKLSADAILGMTSQMRGKTDEEKEELATRFIEELKKIRMEKTEQVTP